MTAPLQKIVKVISLTYTKKRNKKLKNVILSCHHITSSTAADRAAGAIHCWDCYYGKPADWLAEIVMDTDNNRLDGKNSS